ncbi:MAG: hypothetical protein ACRDZO_27560 [Egibacteraceae bacterium]
MPIQSLEVNVSVLDRLPEIHPPGPEALGCITTCTCVVQGTNVYITD